MRRRSRRSRRSRPVRWAGLSGSRGFTRGFCPIGSACPHWLVRPSGVVGVVGPNRAIRVHFRYTLPCTAVHAPCTAVHAPCTVHTRPCTVQTRPCTVHIRPCTVHIRPCTVHIRPCTVHSRPCTVHARPCTGCARALSTAVHSAITSHLAKHSCLVRELYLTTVGTRVVETAPALS